jgi:hypothetical protein
LAESSNNLPARTSQTRLAELIGAQVTIVDGTDHLGALGRPEFFAAIQVFIKSHGE